MNKIFDVIMDKERHERNSLMLLQYRIQTQLLPFDFSNSHIINEYQLLILIASNHKELTCIEQTSYNSRNGKRFHQSPSKTKAPFRTQRFNRKCFSHIVANAHNLQYLLGTSFNNYSHINNFQQNGS